jgi:hypothetical protein
VSELPLNFDETQFEAALVELTERPELFDESFDEAVKCSTAARYFVAECNSLSSAKESEDVCKKHLRYLLTNKGLRNDLSEILFERGTPTRSGLQTVAQLIVQVAYIRYSLHKPRSSNVPNVIANRT